MLGAMVALVGCQRPTEASREAPGGLELRGVARLVAVPPHPVVEISAPYEANLVVGSDGIPQRLELQVDLSGLSCDDAGWLEALRSPGYFGQAAALTLRSEAIAPLGDGRFQVFGQWSTGDGETSVRATGTVDREAGTRVWRLAPALDLRELRESGQADVDPGFLVELVMEAPT